jgi:hypothetical protein
MVATQCLFRTIPLFIVGSQIEITANEKRVAQSLYSIPVHTVRHTKHTFPEFSVRSVYLLMEEFFPYKNNATSTCERPCFATCGRREAAWHGPAITWCGRVRRPVPASSIATYRGCRAKRGLSGVSAAPATSGKRMFMKVVAVVPKSLAG